MTTNLTDLVGQSLMLSFAGPRLTPAVQEALTRIRPVGVILYFYSRLVILSSCHQ